MWQMWPFKKKILQLPVEAPSTYGDPLMKFRLFDWLEEAEKWNMFTPDMHQLDQYTHQLVFICDEMMSRRPFSHYIKDGVMLAVAWSAPKVSVWQRGSKHNNTQVIPLETKFNSVPFASVKGELWSLPVRNLFDIDRYKQNGVQFERRRVKIIVRHRGVYDIKERDKIAEALHTTTLPENKIMTSQQRISFHRAWMYFGNPLHWQIDNGFEFTKVSAFKPKNPFEDIDEYYYYRNPER